MKYKLYNKTRFLKSDEAVIDQEGNILILDDGDAPNHIRNCLDVDILPYTQGTDDNEKTIIKGDILLIGGDCYFVDYINDKFLLIAFTQQKNGDITIQKFNFDYREWFAEVKRVGNIYESKQMKMFYRSVVDNYQRN